MNQSYEHIFFQSFMFFLAVVYMLTNAVISRQFRFTSGKFNKHISKVFLSSMSEFESSSVVPEVLDRGILLSRNLNFVKSRMHASAENVGRDPSTIQLIAVSKTKPNEDIMILYDNGHRSFGENYFQELVEKAAALPSDISWNFIGHLQSSKASKLIRDVPNLGVVETVDSIKLAKKLNNACEGVNRAKLQILIQVDTSNEETKSGVHPDELMEFAISVRDDCPFLSIGGLMTIGAPGDMSCFDRLVECRLMLAGAIGVEPESLALSMGMSGDFEEAIARGATSVRVGSTIFGERDYSKST